MEYLDKSNLRFRRIFCIGRNYRAHAEELNSEIPSEPVIFMKPATCLVEEGVEIPYPAHGRLLHQEAELVVLLGREGKPEDPEQALDFIEGLGLGLDLTLRDVQDQLKGKGLPWEKSKSFDFSSPLGSILAYDRSIDLNDVSFNCLVNSELRQQGHTGNMLFSVPELILAVSRIWKLYPGDLVYTGTPAGVGKIESGDIITISGELFGSFSWRIN